MIYNYNKLTPFKKYIIQNFPYIDADFDSLNNYGLYCKVVEYLNKVIDSTNNQNEYIEELTTAFNSLHDYVENYFENLDVQDEINNKLDEMVTTGQLQGMVNNIFDSLQNQITALASGSPAGVYATVEDLTTADPDHSRIYVVSSSGHWYYYNTTSSTWADGGVYQSSVNEFDNTLTGNNQVANSKAIGDRINQDYYQKNLFTIIDNYYYNAVGTLVESSATFCTKQPIELKQGDSLYYQYNGENKNNVITHIIKCDNLGNFISRSSYTSGLYIADSDCFVLLNFSKTNLSDYATLSTLSVNQPLNDIYSTDFYSSNKELSNANKKDIDDITEQYNYFDISDSFINGNIQSTGIYLKRADNDYFTTNLIETKSGDVFKCAYFGETTANYVLFQVCKYDENKRFIERSSVNSTTYTSNFNGYVRFNVPKGSTDDVENNFVLAKNEDITRYYPNKKYLANNENLNKVAISKIDSNNFLISFGLFNVLLFRTVNQSTNQDNWNLKEIKRGSNVIVPAGTDILGPVKINENTDFIGGVHGDETTNNIKISIDGVNYDISDISTPLSGDSLTILMKSSVYDQISQDKAFDRYVTIIITDNKIHVSNNYTAAKNLTLKRATNGGLIACQNPIIKNIMLNNYYFNSAPTTQQSVNSKTNTMATISTIYGSITVRNIIGHENENYSGYLNVFTNESPIRNKIYFDTYKEGSYNISTLQQINGEFEYIFA